MFGNLFKKKEIEDNNEEYNRDEAIQEQVKIIESMNLTDLMTFVKNGNERYPITDEGLAAVLYRFINLTTPSKSYPEGKREFEEGDLDARTKKGFDIVLQIANTNCISEATAQMVLDFIESYSNLIRIFDQRNAQIYADKLIKAAERAQIIVEKRQKFQDEFKPL